MLASGGTAQDTLQSVKSKGKRHRRQQVRRNMTYQAFCQYYQEPTHGNYKAEALRAKWDTETRGETPADTKGIVDGTGGHQRFRIVLEDADDSISESESAEQRQHLLSTKPGEATMQDIIDFLEWGCGPRDHRRLGDSPQICQNATPSLSIRPSH